MCQLMCEGLDEYLSIDEGAQNRVPDVVLLADTLVKHRKEAVGGINIATIVAAGGLGAIAATSSELHVREIGLHSNSSKLQNSQPCTAWRNDQHAPVETTYM